MTVLRTTILRVAAATPDCTRCLSRDAGAQVLRPYARLATSSIGSHEMDPRDITALIEQNLPGARAHVQTDGQGHYEATVICAAFAGKRSLQRHQMVYGTLGTRVGREIHALQLQTLTPEEWQARPQ